MKTEFVLMGKQFKVASRRSRRHLVVLIYVAFAALIVAYFFGYANLLLLAAFSITVSILGGRGREGGLIPPVHAGDEREKSRRDHAYFLAYWWLDLLLMPALFALAVKWGYHPAVWSPAFREFVDHLRVAPFIAAAGVLYYTLPQAILLWTEPDMEEPQQAS